MAWYIAASLEKLRAQLNALAPNRSKVSDGGIGDKDHSSRASDHNPIAGTGQVCARDFTHDPGGGLDCHWLARTLVQNRDARIKYIIWDRRIWTLNLGWQSYGGDNPHTKHLHLSVRSGALGDGTREWVLNVPAPGGGDQENEMLNAEQDQRLREIAVAILGTAKPVHPTDSKMGLRELTEPEKSLVPGSAYEASTAVYVRQVDARTYKMITEMLPGLAERMAKIEAQLAEIISTVGANQEGEPTHE
jgi:hypothetical protein